jgi:hypothetical protein
MSRYITQQNDFSINIFNSYYEEAYKYELDFFKDTMIMLYKNYVKNRGKCNPADKELDNIDSIYSTEFWLNKYIMFKDLEYEKNN